MHCSGVSVKACFGTEAGQAITSSLAGVAAMTTAPIENNTRGQSYVVPRDDGQGVIYLTNLALEPREYVVGFEVQSKLVRCSKALQRVFARWRRRRRRFRERCRLSLLTQHLLQRVELPTNGRPHGGAHRGVLSPHGSARESPRHKRDHCGCGRRSEYPGHAEQVGEKRPRELDRLGLCARISVAKAADSSNNDDPRS